MEKSLPRRCAECGQKAVKPEVVPYHTKMKHENTLHDVYLPSLEVDQCANCKAIYISEQADLAIRAALREKLGLLRPEIIVACKNELDHSQEQIANLWGFAPETFSRWLAGSLQSRSSDRMLRVYFGVPEARDFLERLGSDSSLGEYVVWKVNKPQVVYVDLSCQGAAVAYDALIDVSQPAQATSKPVVPVKPENGPDPPLHPPNVDCLSDLTSRAALHERKNSKTRRFWQRRSDRQPCRAIS